MERTGWSGAERKRLLARSLRNGTSFKERILKHFRIPTTPSAPLRKLRIFIIDGAATPPVSGGELPADIHLTSLGNIP